MFRKVFKMRKNVQIGIKSKKIDQYVASFVKISSNKLRTLQPSANISSQDNLSIGFMLKLFVFAESKFCLGKFPAINMPPCTSPPNISPPLKICPPKRDFEIFYKPMVLYTGYYGLCISFHFFTLVCFGL